MAQYSLDTLLSLSAAATASDKAGRRSNKRPRVAAADEATIQGLPVVKSPKLQEECAMCLKDFDTDDKLRAMLCAHTFHEQCIFQWLRRNAFCPLCRQQLPTKD